MGKNDVVIQNVPWFLPFHCFIALACIKLRMKIVSLNKIFAGNHTSNPRDANKSGFIAWHSVEASTEYIKLIATMEQQIQHNQLLHEI